MNYMISDLIQKIIDIERDILKIYKEIQCMFENKPKVVGIIARAIEKEEQAHIGYYERLKEELQGDLNEVIDFYLYDKVSKLIYEFRSHLLVPKIDNVQDLIEYIVELKKNIISLLIDVQGRLLEKLDDINNNIYKVMSRIIKEEEKHEKMFEQLVVHKK
ncbi:rubrerythrin family protein [Clostridium chromiireducens]|uniref:Rubrerythrin family protein n=1 Tax=Clostridium chromiireducens TaxID=225345 RepID=A0A1V4IR72_9CLOT|nr:rubrerythrin family protein [Clostridium chromiireducens]OPJ62304.1 hypothetical protein CLCHR_20400 [Clostridium chromiireducens]